MERDQATKLVHGLLKKMVDKNGSDLFITTGFPPAIKIDGEIHRAAEQPLTGDESAIIVRSIMNDRQAADFEASKECNFAISPSGIGRFRVALFFAQAHPEVLGVARVALLDHFVQDLAGVLKRYPDRLTFLHLDLGGRESHGVGHR